MSQDSSLTEKKKCSQKKKKLQGGAEEHYTATYVERKLLPVPPLTEQSLLRNPPRIPMIHLVVVHGSKKKDAEKFARIYHPGSMIEQPSGERKDPVKLRIKIVPSLRNALKLSSSPRVLRPPERIGIALSHVSVVPPEERYAEDGVRLVGASEIDSSLQPVHRPGFFCEVMW